MHQTCKILLVYIATKFGKRTKFLPVHAYGSWPFAVNYHYRWNQHCSIRLWEMPASDSTRSSNARPHLSKWVLLMFGSLPTGERIGYIFSSGARVGMPRNVLGCGPLVQPENNQLQFAVRLSKEKLRVVAYRNLVRNVCLGFPDPLWLLVEKCKN